MGMFDTISVVNLSDKNFKHNGASFQTKSLDCDGSEFVIFNGQLYQQYNGHSMERYAEAVPLLFSGDINIYTDHTNGDRTYWIEYDLTIVSGKVMSVAIIAEQLTADRSDKSSQRPSPKTNSTCITLDFRGVSSQVYDAFHAELDANLDKLRSAIGDPKAEIIYQVKSSNTGIYSVGSSSRWLHSVVQDMSAFQMVKLGHLTQKDSTGNSFTLIMDEFHSHSLK